MTATTEVAVPEPSDGTYCGGFTCGVGNLKLFLGYATFPDGRVLLQCFEQIGPQPPTLWRQFWTGFENAVDVASDLCADACEYLDQFNAPMRPYEDLDLDAYLEHIHLRVTNGFH